MVIVLADLKVSLNNFLIGRVLMCHWTTW